MAPTFHVFRHAEGKHRGSDLWKTRRDLGLMSLGRLQCTELRDSFPWTDQVTHIVSSPIRRTLTSCLLAFEPALDGESRDGKDE